MIFGGYRNRQFMWVRLVMIVLLVLALVVFKGHGSAYVGLRVGYFVLLAGLLIFRLGAVKRRGPRDPYMPRQGSTVPQNYHQLPTSPTPTAPTTTAPGPASETPPGSSPGLTWGGLPPEGPPANPPPA
jgi:hypothetical protein